MARLQEDYKKKVLPALVKEFNYTSIMQAPKITKITQHCKEQHWIYEWAFLFQ
jgi:ribosomal protein L5